jgi:hypothetical protein
MKLNKALILTPFLMLTTLYSPNSDVYFKKYQDETKSKLENLIKNSKINITQFSLDAEKLKGNDVHDSIYVITNNLINSIVSDSNLIKLSNKKELDINDAKTFAKIPFQKIKKNFKYKNTNLLSVGIKEKNIDCYLGSLLYISCAERLGLDVRYVLLPHLREKTKTNQIHGLVRFYLNKEKYINIETTNGKIVEDKELLEKYNISEEMIKNKAFFKSYEKNELESEIITSISYDNSMTKELFLRKALELNPNSYLANQVLATHLYNNKRYEEAIPFYKKTIKVYPENNQLNIYLENCYKIVNSNKELTKEKIIVVEK